MVQDPITAIAGDVRELKERTGRIETDVRELTERTGHIETNLREVTDRLGRVELNSVKAQADIAQIKQTLIRHDQRFDALELKVDQGFLGLQNEIGKLSALTTGLAGAVTSMLGQISITRAIEERLDKIENAVFGAKS